MTKRTMKFITETQIQHRNAAVFEVQPGFVKKFFANTANTPICGHVIIGFYPEKKQIVAYPCSNTGIVVDDEWFFSEEVVEGTDAEQQEEKMIEAFYRLVCAIKGIQPVNFQEKAG